MLHEEIIGKFLEYRTNTLAPKEKIWVKRHLQTCTHCGMLYARWNDAKAPAGLAKTVMARLAQSRPSFSYSRWSLSGAAVAAALIAAAFWHPERSWLKADHNFGLFDGHRPVMSSLPSSGEEKEKG